MRRRPFLHLAAGAVATAGCLGTSEAPDDSPSEATDTTAAGTNSTTASTGDSSTEMAATDGGPLAVDRVETFDYVVRMNDLGHDPGGGIVQFADLDDREQEVVDGALDGGYETDDPPAWLVQFASRTPHVAQSGTYYRLDHDFPTTTVTAETVEESDVNGAIADYEGYEQAVTHDGRVMSGLLRIARREGMEFTYVWPSLREFLDEYAAVRYHGDVVSMSAEVEDSGPPYAITASEVSVSEAVGDDVWDVSAADSEVRELVRQAGTFGGAYGFDGAPSGLFDRLETHRYAYLDGTFYTTYIEKRDPAPVSVSAEFEAGLSESDGAGETDGTSESDGAGESGGTTGSLTLSLTSDADRELDISTGAPRPFGVLHFHPVGDPDDSRVLWTDAYEESDHVQTDGREVKSINSIGLQMALAPGETVSETYAVRTENLSSGEYAVDGWVGVESSGGESGDSETVRYRLVFSVA